jgi:hypothetical protein
MGEGRRESCTEPSLNTLSKDDNHKVVFALSLSRQPGTFLYSCFHLLRIPAFFSVFCLK